MSSEVVLVERHGPITHLILNRPEVRNALNITLLTQLIVELDAVAADPTQRVVILRGAGPCFCAGLDLKEAADPAIAHESATLVGAILAKLVESPAVTIAAAHKAAIAGGAGLIMACDFVVVDPTFKTGFPEVHRGLVAGLVMTLLRRQVAERTARELLILGETIDAFAARVRAIHDEIRAAPGDPVLLFGHGAWHGCLHCIVAGRPVTEFSRHHGIANGGLVRIGVAGPAAGSGGVELSSIR